MLHEPIPAARPDEGPWVSVRGGRWVRPDWTGRPGGGARGLGRSILDRIGRVTIDLGPTPLVEQVVRVLKTRDKPAIRLIVGTAVALSGGLSAVTLGRRPPGAGVAGAASLAVLVGARHRLGQQRQRYDRDAGALRIAHRAPPSVDGAEDWGHPTALITPVESFYVTDINMRPPLVDRSTWRLTMSDGQDRSVLALTDLHRWELEEFDATLVCVHQRLGWDRLGHQQWAGVSLSDAFELAGLNPDAPDGDVDLLLTAVDGWTQLMPARVVGQFRPWLVLGMGGQPLRAAHGAPARLLTPGIVGQYGAAKWLERIELVAAGSRSSTWQRKGWPRQSVTVPPSSRIDSPTHGAVVAAGPTTVMGVAWAPPIGVAALEVRVDDGPWHPAELAAELSPWSWRRWRSEEQLGCGDHRIQVRTTTRDGTVQSGIVRPPFPLGQTGWHAVSVKTRPLDS